MPAERLGAVVIGAGVIGLACARVLAMRGIAAIIVERSDGIGQEISSRNSEVIHAGLYYPMDSLKARYCVEGNRRLYEYCQARGIPYKRCGKLIVATSPAHEEKLDQLHRQALANGVKDACMLTAVQARSLEPRLSCSAALLSPSTGIIDSHRLMLSLLGEAEDRGAVLALGSTVLDGELDETGALLRVASADGEMHLASNIVINAAGLYAPEVASRIDGLAPTSIPRAYLAKGNYFSLSGRSPFSRLIYPIPEPGGLGVHFTLDLGGQAKFGPDVEWVSSIDYAVDQNRANNFYAEIRKYWPALPDNSLTPAYSGIRPKISGPGEPNADFLIQGPADHGAKGLVNLYGIESPGLTSCLAIADAVCDALGIANAGHV